MECRDLSEDLLTGLMTPAEFALAVGKTERTVRRYMKMGLPSTKRGNMRLISIDRARQWLVGEEQLKKRVRGRPRNILVTNGCSK